MRAAISLLLLLLPATFVAVARCSAQRRLEVTRSVGAYAAGADSRITMAIGCFGVDTNCIDGTDVGQDDAVMGGVRLTAWLGKLGTEVGVAYSPSPTVSRAYHCDCTANFGGRCSCSSATGTDRSSRVVTGSARVLRTFGVPTLRHPLLYVVAGVGFLNRSGSGVEAAEQTAGTAVPRTYWGPLFGVGARMLATLTTTLGTELVVVFPQLEGPSPGSCPDPGVLEDARERRGEGRLGSGSRVGLSDD